MKTLFVLRHAKAMRDSDSGKDFDRALAERGWRDAERVGREMCTRNLIPDRVLASPAKRAAETVTSFLRGFGQLPVEYEARIYDASTSRLLEVIHESEDAIDRLLLVGHNPGLENLILRLAGDDHSDLCDRIVDGFPTAAIAAVELPVDSWSDVRERSGKIVELILPKELG